MEFKTKTFGLFNRKEYLELSKDFEKEEIEYVDSELSEFNDDPESLAFELAYTRYFLAKAEQALDLRISKVEFAKTMEAMRKPIKD